MNAKLAYRAEVDGLRAVAVLAVIASHLPEKFLQSGFLGVDVFFAISGYVVTASLLGQPRSGLLQLYVEFLSRRVRRLLPALTLCVAVTGIVVLATDPFPRHSSVETGARRRSATRPEIAPTSPDTSVPMPPAKLAK